MKNDVVATSRSRVVMGAFLLVGFVITYFPVWRGLVKAWLASDDDSHGLFIVPICLFMLWHKRKRLAEVNLSPTWWGLAAVILSLSLYITAHVSEIATVSALAMVLFLVSVVLYYGGLPLLREMLFPLCFLILMIPIPSEIYTTLTVPLQLIVTKYSVWIAARLSVPIYYEGNVIFLPERTIQVVQACSGLRSIMTLLTLGAVIGYFTMKSRGFRAILFVAGIPVAIAVNIVRVVTLVTFLRFFNIDLTRESVHGLFGLGIFMLSLAIMMGIQKGLTTWERATA